MAPPEPTRAPTSARYRRWATPKRLAGAIAGALLVSVTAVAAAGIFTTQDVPAFGPGNSAYVNQEVTKDSRGAIVSVRSPLYRALPSHPAIQFPAGVGYRAAVTALFEARVKGQAVPDGATLVDPLPSGRVVRVANNVVQLDPAAPIGYDLDSGRVVDASFSMPGNLTEAELGERINEARRLGLAVPRDGWVTAGPIPRCEISLGPTDQAAGCDEPGADTRPVNP